MSKEVYMNVRRKTSMVVCLSVLSCLSPFTLIRAQTTPAGYEAKWRSVDSLSVKAGLTESALVAVNRIYTLAKQEKNEAQMIHALVYRMDLEANNREDAIPGSIKELDKEIAEARQPVRSILQNILAGVYWSYFQQNRFKLYNRTNTIHLIKDDPATWTMADFHKKIGDLYRLSLGEDRLLQSIRVDAFAPILIKGNRRNLRPSLFDLLAHEALEYFKSDEQDINRPASLFVIDDPAAFSDAATFAGHPFRTEDSLALHFTAMRLFQQMIRSHLSDPQPDALLDVDIERISFAHTYSVTDNKDSFYLRALERLSDRYGLLPAAAEAWYLQAQHYTLQAEDNNQISAGDDPSGNKAPNGNILAKAICDKVLMEKDSSEGRTDCEILLHNILQKELALQTEMVNLPDQPLRSLINWRNLDKLYLRLVRLDNFGKDLPAMNTWTDPFWDNLLGLPVYWSSSQVLPATNDYQTHRSEIAIPSLPVGVYALVASSTPGWSRTAGVMAVHYIYVSAIAYIYHGNDFFVLNRGTGQPLPGASVQIWERTYNSRARATELVKKDHYETDSQGHFTLKERPDQNYNAWVPEIMIAGDRLFVQEAMLPIGFNYEEKTDSSIGGAEFEKRNAHTFFFLDRSIYRPGQTLYFKGIAVTQDFDTRKTKILPGLLRKVVLYDANGGVVDSMRMTTNEFGSYHGMFRLPENRLNGKFRLSDEPVGAGQFSTGTYFSVEEYKRPRFYVEYETPKGSYRVGDTIRVAGNVKAYAGNTIDGAKVRYRVVRMARFPHSWLFWRTEMPQSTGQEIAHGEVKTTATGTFSFVFKALPDRSVRPSSEPEFDYSISADITDINGETRSGSSTITAAYTVLKLAVGIPGGDRLPADSLRSLSVSVTNLAGQPIPATVHIAAYPLQAPDRLIRGRLWPTPDRFVLTEKAFLDSFPHDEYREETKKESWARGGKIWDTLVSVTGSDGHLKDQRKGIFAQAVADASVTIPDGRFVPGWYVIEVKTSDRYGQEVKDLHYMELFDGRSGRPSNPQYNWAVGDTKTAEPGEKVQVMAGTSAEGVFVIRTTEKTMESISGWPRKPLRVSSPGSGEASGDLGYLHLNKESKRTEYTITEADRGGFGVMDAFIKDNRLYTHSTVVTVPWTNKELAIHYTSYRDKTEPGSGEKWQVSISGYRKEQVSAEVVAAMYDASLDQFVPHRWSKPDLNPLYWTRSDWQGGINFQPTFSHNRIFGEYVQPVYIKEYDRLLTPFGRSGRGGGHYRMALNEVALSSPARANGTPGAPAPMIRIRGTELKKDEVVYDRLQGKVAGVNVVADSTNIVVGFGSKRLMGNLEGVAGKEAPVPEVVIRKNFNETAFFFPDLRTDTAGNVSFSFTMPEALTRWKWMTLAHTRDAAFGYAEKEIVTQKKLMVQPNVPRFLREGDRMELSVKVVNLTDSELTGQVALQLTDPTTGQTADGWFVNRQPNQYFTIGAGQSGVVGFPLDIPYQYNRPLTYRFVAQARNYSDGEEATLPVVSNRMLVTEALPLNMPGDGTRHFTLDKLLQSGSSETLNHHALTVEFTANPAWYAVQALPYLIEYPFECAEQTFNRFYANALAEKIVSASPRLQQVFANWRTEDTAALLSNLQKNQELRSILLEETPWVLQGKTEEQQKKNIALLFDMARMSRELSSTMDKLKDMQTQGGGFVWFKGGPDDRYITQYILTGIGRLQKLNALPAALTGKIKEMVAAALPYLDDRIREDYDAEKKQEVKAGSRSIRELPVQYLYMRSFFSDYGLPGNIFPAVSYYRKQAQQSWVQSSKYLQGMIALALFRTGDVQTARNILASLRQNAIRDEEKGMYWKGMEGGYYWYQAPVEIQSQLIETFHEISGDAGIERDLKTWLLKRKQTHNWPTTKATADACYALLLGGSDWLDADRDLEIRLGDKTIEWQRGEAGTGYYKKIFDAPFVNPSMGNITVTMHTRSDSHAAAISNSSASSSAGSGSATSNSTGSGSTAPNAPGSPAWGPVYWQYFDNLDRINPSGGGDAKAVDHGKASGVRGVPQPMAPLKVVRKLFIERNTDRGPVLEPIAENGTLKVGDKVRVRIELQADRDMEYVHLKDMRAACMEPLNVISQYKWQGGLGYYETTRDAATDFFFQELPRGTYIFEYALFAGQTGNFSNGVTNIECMYAPEFAFHTEGIRVNVESAP